MQFENIHFSVCKFIYTTVRSSQQYFYHGWSLVHGAFEVCVVRHLAVIIMQGCADNLNKGD